MLYVFFQTMPKPLNWLALMSIAILLLKVFYLNEIAEPVEGLSNLGVITEGVLASVLASYVFYVLVVHMKEWKDKRLVYPHLNKWSKAVVSECRSQVLDLGKTVGISLELDSLTKSQLEAAMKKIDPKSDAPLILGTKYANWLQYFQYHRDSTKPRISELLLQLPFLDASLVPLLVDIRDCSHFVVVDILASVPLKNADLGMFTNAFFTYCQACSALENHISKSPWHEAVG